MENGKLLQWGLYYSCIIPQNWKGASLSKVGLHVRPSAFLCSSDFVQKTNQQGVDDSTEYFFLKSQRSLLKHPKPEKAQSSYMHICSTNIIRVVINLLLTWSVGRGWCGLQTFSRRPRAICFHVFFSLLFDNANSSVHVWSASVSGKVILALSEEKTCFPSSEKSFWSGQAGGMADIAKFVNS